MNKLFKVLKQNLMMLKKKKFLCFVKCSNKTLLNGINEVCNWKIWWYNNVFDVSHVVLVGFKRFDQKMMFFFNPTGFTATWDTWRFEKWVEKNTKM